MTDTWRKLPMMTWKSHTMIHSPLKEGELEERIRYYEDLIEPVYKTGQYPQGFRLNPKDWSLDQEILDRGHVDTMIDDKLTKIRPIGAMDVEFLSNDTVESAKDGIVDLVLDYPCGLNCPGCFSQENIYGDSERLMKWEEIIEKIDNARDIGLQSIKFLGPGELFQDPDLFDILDACEERELPISIFTKGAELGDDELAKQNYGHLGINSAQELVDRIASYDTVRILLGFNSFIPARQDKMVGSYSKTANYQIVDGKFVDRGISDYTTKRDRALVNMVKAGFNDPERGQRLTLINTPVGIEQIDEIPDMYAWAASRNIPVIIAQTMESGPKAKGLMRYNQRIDETHQRLVELFEAVYSRAINDGIMTMDQVKEEGISAYMGTAPCDQVANGLYLRLNGQVQMCPGKSDESAVYGNVHDTPIQDIWYNSPHYELGPLRNNWCAAKVNGMPQWIQEEVLTRLNEKFE